MIAALLIFARYQDHRRIASSGDSYWYMRQAQIFAGVPAAEASATASQLMCDDMNRGRRDAGLPDACTHYSMAGVSPRYVAIFTGRPFYPLFAAPFVAVLGVWPGMIGATVILALCTVVLAYLAVWLATGRRLAGVFASALMLLLPSGFWMTRLLVEGATLAGYFAVLIGAMLAWRGRLRSGLTISAIAVIWLFGTRSASGTAVSLALTAAAAAALLTRAPNRRAVLLIGGLGLAAVAIWFAVSSVFHQPSLYDTIQDYATRHFRKPDIPDPYQWLLLQNEKFWPAQARHLLLVPLSLVAWLFAAAVLGVRSRHVAWLWVTAGGSGLLMLVAHPLADQYDRLMTPMWITVAAGLGYACALPWSAGAPALVPRQQARHDGPVSTASRPRRAKAVTNA